MAQRFHFDPDTHYHAPDAQTVAAPTSIPQPTTTPREGGTMSEQTYRFWTFESGSGETYAIRMSTPSGDITGVCGPIYYGDREHPLDDFEYETEDIDWVLEHSGEFRDTTTPEEFERRAYDR